MCLIFIDSEKHQIMVQVLEETGDNSPIKKEDKYSNATFYIKFK